MGITNKRIAIARAIMYKELEKRREEREIECKRRGLWSLWKYQTRYKTLWHFLRASDERLIMLCDECITVLLDRCSDYMNEIIYLKQHHDKNPCEENYVQITNYRNLYNKCARAYNEIASTRNNLYGGNYDDTQD